jgi:hypothetical protein
MEAPFALPRIPGPVHCPVFPGDAGDNERLIELLLHKFPEGVIVTSCPTFTLTTVLEKQLPLSPYTV